MIDYPPEDLFKQLADLNRLLTEKENELNNIEEFEKFIDSILDAPHDGEDVV